VPGVRALVIGHSQDALQELHTDAVIRDGIPVLRRMGGGGAVLLSPGCVCVGLRYARLKGRGIHDFFASAADFMRAVVAESFGISLEMRGISDLAHAGPSGLRKVAGCSLYMPRDFALYLASILVRPDPGEIETYLAHPSREPDYRGGRRHRDFIVGLEELAGRPLPPAEVAAALESALENRLRLELDYPAES
jgi:lipoate-protein ligase A